MQVCDPFAEGTEYGVPDSVARQVGVIGRLWKQQAHADLRYTQFLNQTGRIDAEQFGDRGLIAVVSDHEGKGGRLSLFEPVEDRLGQDRVAIDKAWCKGPAATGDAGEGLGGDPA